MTDIIPIKPSLRKLRVLVVDDNRTLAKTLGWMVELMGHDVRVAHSSSDALALAQSFRPDAVLLDIGLPEMNGYEICKTMRAAPQLKHCVIIAQTGWNNPEDHQRSEAAGFDHYLVKPIPMENLEKLLLSLPVPASGVA